MPSSEVEMPGLIACVAEFGHNAIVGNIGHFDNEIDMEGLAKATKRMNIKLKWIALYFRMGRVLSSLPRGVC
jgi:adenosylhomocysteinase